MPLHEYSARYGTGYLDDNGVPVDPASMDFSVWFEAYLVGAWFISMPATIVIARGRDAAAVAISTRFGPAQLARSAVIAEEVDNIAAQAA